MSDGVRRTGSPTPVSRPAATAVDVFAWFRERDRGRDDGRYSGNGIDIASSARRLQGVRQ
jgi:hypothetical protein